MNAQLLFDALSPRVLRCWLLLASLLIGSGCDWLALPVCRLSPMTTGCPDGGVTPDLAAVNRDAALSPFRQFQWRAGINNNKDQKFVGILQREYAVTVSRLPVVSFSAVRFHLDRPQNQMQLEQAACPMCPLPTKIKLPEDIKSTTDSVYLTNDAAPAFWLLRDVAVAGAADEVYTIKENGDLTSVDVNLDMKIARQPFFHPILDASLIPTKSMVGQSSDGLRLTVGTKPFVATHNETGSITAAMIGDIDATDHVKNDVEVVRFAGTSVASVYHYDPESQSKSLDEYLRIALNDEIRRRNPGPDEKIGAAYVNDLDKDGFLDFVFSLGVNVYVSSYKGKPANSSLPVFAAWPEKVLSVPADEKIQSIIAMDITKDGYPELIVVTDKFVHFYLNTP